MAAPHPDTARTGLCLLSLATACLDPAPTAYRRDVNEVETTEPLPPHDGFAPAAFQVAEASFALDLEAQVARGLEDRPIRLVVGIYDEDYVNTGDPTATNHCTVALETPGPAPLAAWAGAEGAWSAFEVHVPSDPSSDCGGLDFPPEWGDDPADAVARWTWSAGLNPMPADLAEDLADAWRDVWATRGPLVVGAGYGWERLTELLDGEGPEEHDRYVERGWAFGWAIDGDELRLIDGERVPLTAEAIAAGTDGWYETAHVGLLQPASRLLDP